MLECFLLWLPFLSKLEKLSHISSASSLLKFSGSPVDLVSRLLPKESDISPNLGDGGAFKCLLESSFNMSTKLSFFLFWLYENTDCTYFAMEGPFWMLDCMMFSKLPLCCLSSFSKVNLLGSSILSLLCKVFCFTKWSFLLLCFVEIKFNMSAWLHDFLNLNTVSSRSLGFWVLYDSS